MAHKRKRLTLVQKLKLSIKGLETSNRNLLQNYLTLDGDHKQAIARLTWMEEQAKRDRLLIEHLVETAKLSAAKGVQAQVWRR